MATIERFEDFQAWQTARTLTNLVYDLTRQDTFAKDFGLRDQIRRAAVSIMSNIAEEFENRTPSQFINHPGMAKGSAGEVRCQLYVARDQQYIAQTQFDNAFDLADKVSRQIASFIAYLEAKTDMPSRR